MERVAIISEAVKGPRCLLQLEASYVLIRYSQGVRRSTRKRPREVSLEDASHCVLPISRARLGESGGKTEGSF